MECLKVPHYSCFQYAVHVCCYVAFVCLHASNLINDSGRNIPAFSLFKLNWKWGKEMIIEFYAPFILPFFLEFPAKVKSHVY